MTSVATLPARPCDQCGEFFIPKRPSSTTCPEARCKNRKAHAAADVIVAKAAHADAAVPEADRPRPKFCGLCPRQSRNGNHACNHQRIGTQWISQPASEARIHGGCPWGRPVVNGGKP